ncbi:hypothetical protein BJ508DRAFT_376703 [Ascobolus immersus RN42]|uniref:Uncharacterized protein n=1 Tax=Ascobolus immersus RN42 TaxID=1160509 RepID=A0A3N4I4H5_ASCIM|nr:hypothetical protein BJ508DRAFT_376703 [Ascobolus immersus RN42]
MVGDHWDLAPHQRLESFLLSYIAFLRHQQKYAANIRRSTQSSANLSFFHNNNAHIKSNHQNFRDRPESETSTELPADQKLRFLLTLQQFQLQVFSGYGFGRHRSGPLPHNLTRSFEQTPTMAELVLWDREGRERHPRNPHLLWPTLEENVPYGSDKALEMRWNYTDSPFTWVMSIWVKYKRDLGLTDKTLVYNEQLKDPIPNTGKFFWKPVVDAYENKSDTSFLLQDYEYVLIFTFGGTRDRDYPRVWSRLETENGYYFRFYDAKKLEEEDPDEEKSSAPNESPKDESPKPAPSIESPSSPSFPASATSSSSSSTGVVDDKDSNHSPGLIISKNDVSSTKSNKDERETPVTAITGGVLGGVIILGIMALIYYWAKKRGERLAQEKFEKPELDNTATATVGEKGVFGEGLGLPVSELDANARLELDGNGLSELEGNARATIGEAEVTGLR